MEENKNPYQNQINAAAGKYGIDAGFLTKLIGIESNYNPNAVSPTGPKGLGQFTKATGAAYGLNSDADFFNPDKSIDASAHLISDLLQKNNGDYVRSALAYNQGMGTAGTPQLSAYDKNDWSMISTEGQKYIKNFSAWDDGSDDARTQFLNTQGDVQQQPNPVFSTTTVNSTENANSEQNSQPDSSTTLSPTIPIPQQPVVQPASFDITAGNAQNVTIPSLGDNYEVDMFNNPPQEESFIDGVLSYAKASTMSNFLQDANHYLRWQSMNPAMPSGDVQGNITDPNGFVPNNSDIDYLQNSGLSPQNYSQVDGAFTSDDFRFKVDQALRNQQNNQGMKDAGTGGTIVGNIAQIALDPTSYIPMGGAAIKGFKLLNPSLTTAAKWGVLGGITTGASIGVHDFVSNTNNDLDDYLKLMSYGVAVGAAFGGIASHFIQPKNVSSTVSDAVDNGISDVIPGSISDVQNTADTLSQNAAAKAQRVEASESAETINGVHMERNVPEMDKDPVLPGVYEHPFEQGAYVTQDGVNISPDNILNPETAQKSIILKNGEVPTAENSSAKAFAVRLGSFGEIGNDIHSVNNPEVKALGDLLFRPTSVLRDGSRGNFGLTASDTIQYIDGIDNLWTSKYVSNKKAALKLAQYSIMPDAQAESILNRKVVEAIEDSSGNKMSALTSEEQNFAKHIQQNFIMKEDFAVNPKQLGSENAVPLLDKSFNSGNYVPRHYSPDKINSLRERLASMGLDKFDDMKDILKQSFKKSYLSSPDIANELERRIVNDNFGGERLEKPVRNSFKKVDDYNKAVEDYNNQSKEISSLVDDHIEKLSYGILRGDDNNLADVSMNLWGNDGATVSDSNFLKERSPLSTDQVIKLPDGSNFSVNDIRDFDLDPIVEGYNNSIKHKLAVASVGLDGSVLRTRVNQLHAELLNNGSKRDSEVLMNAYKIISGQARRDPETALGSLLSSLTSSTFFLRNSYMAAMNFTEIGGALIDGSLRSALDHIPLLRDAFAYNTKAGRETMKSISDMNFGKYIDESFRPSYQDRVEALINNPNATENMAAIKLVSGIRNGIDTANHYNPFSIALRGTTNAIIDAARQTIIGDMVRTAFENKSLPKYLSDSKLNGLSISKENMNDIIQYFHDHIQYNAKGDYTVKDMKAMASDPRGSLFRRLAENYADTVILRPETISSSQTKLLPRALNILTQFKMFSVRSMNGRLMNVIGDSYFNKQYADNSMKFVLSTVLAAMGYIGQTYSQSYAMPPQQQDSYLRNALDPKMLAYNAFARQSFIGGPMGLATTAYGILSGGGGPSQYLRSTNIPDIQQKPAGKTFEGATMYDPSFTSLYGQIAGQIPGLSVATSLASAPYYEAKAMMSPEFSSDKMLNSTAAYNNFRNIVPNNPVVQMMLYHIFSQQGIDSEYFRKQAQK
ncbi:MULTISPECIES: transglycosylase SLT domain-containing protein [unclassified Tatumella]|uniref:transglycosylase SLT domain-containing protein n=1 Tax=unclassified Tatumella TaxID=2649542 RepID=UPI001BAFDD2A|nr:MULTISPECIES: transglycosylase SLT domain-containing protein [unclassified Tatumella]MBS0878865.1 transglycosylase SLT domain-containing protein [Tatumella sp. JGM82]MBS0892374.1 transglycosylase SLT domain-containing protein [Tatumella sp. JGM94]MBS0903463.1 transglycosylase SLT domain-containing protein [Tatumella sp. JGM100]